MPHRGAPPHHHLPRPARLLLALQAFAHNTPLQSNILSFLSRKPSLIHPSSTRVPRRASLTVGLFFLSAWEGPAYASAHLVCGISNCLSPFYRKLWPLLRESRLSLGAGRVSPHQGPGLDFPGYSLMKFTRSGRTPAPQAPISAKDWRLPAPTSKELGALQFRISVARGPALAGET